MASPPLPPGFSSIPVAGLKWKAAPMPSWATTALPGLPAGAAAVDARVDCAPGVLGPHERRMDGDPGMAGGTRGGVTAGAGAGARCVVVVVVWYSAVCCAPGAGAAAGACGGWDPACCIGSSNALRVPRCVRGRRQSRVECLVSRDVSALKRRQAERGNGHLCREKNG